MSVISLIYWYSRHGDTNAALQQPNQPGNQPILLIIGTHQSRPRRVPIIYNLSLPVFVRQTLHAAACWLLLINTNHDVVAMQLFENGRHIMIMSFVILSYLSWWNKDIKVSHSIYARHPTCINIYHGLAEHNRCTCQVPGLRCVSPSTCRSAYLISCLTCRRAK